MHADEINIDATLVARLVSSQFPELAGLPVRRARSTGTVNAIFRLGDELSVRLPRVASWAEDLLRELALLPRIAPALSIRIPEPVAHGAPMDDYPFPWAIYRWIDGQPYDDALIDDETQAAADLAQFVAGLRTIDPQGAPRAGRRPLGELDAATRQALAEARSMIDADAALDAWEEALTAPIWDGEPVIIHADLLRPNLLVDRRRLCAVIDFGSAGAGDPAADLIAAWSVFGRTGRAAYRAALGADEGEWARARGYALHQAALIIPYYAVTNPEFAALARRTIAEILAERA